MIGDFVLPRGCQAYHRTVARVRDGFDAVPIGQNVIDVILMRGRDFWMAGWRPRFARAPLSVSAPCRSALCRSIRHCVTACD